MKTRDIIESMAPLTVNVTYHSNYNGVTIEPSDINTDNFSAVRKDTRIKAAEDDIVNALYSECNDDGEFEGDSDDAVEMITATIKRHFGASATVSVEFDQFST